METPSLVIRRVVVKGKLGCDYRFDHGLNILWATSPDGDPTRTNKVGKTGLIELIQHGLGKRQDSKAKFHFSSISNQLETLWLEIEVNGAVYTIERSLNELSAAYKVREGEYSPAMADLPFETISVNDGSASEWMLKALGIPKASVKKQDGNLDPLTFSLLSRLMILHQEDSYGSMLDKVQPESRKADIIGFLTEITPQERFTMEERLSVVELQVNEYQNTYDTVGSFLERNGIPSIQEAESNMETLELQFQSAREEQISLQVAIRNNTEATSKSPGRTEIIRDGLLRTKDQMAHLSFRVRALEQEEARLREVVATLLTDKQKSMRLRTSSAILSSVEFNVCPRCVQEITTEMRHRELQGRCSLCNRPLRTTSDRVPKTTPRTDDIDLQIDEANIVLGDVLRERGEVSKQLRDLQKEESNFATQLEVETRVYVSPSVDRLVGMSAVLSEVEAKLTRARELRNQAAALEEIRVHLDKLKADKAKLEDLLRESRRASREKIEELRQIYDGILRAVNFRDYKDCSIDSQTLLPYINGSLYTANGAAYKALAVTCYHLAIFIFSLRRKTLYPRFLILDSPQIHDLNNDTYDKFLQFLARLAENNTDADGKNNWQIILTTRRLTDNLRPYVFAELFSPERMLLK